MERCGAGSSELKIFLPDWQMSPCKSRNPNVWTVSLVMGKDLGLLGERVSDCVAVGLELAIGHLGKPCEQLVTLSIWSVSLFLASAFLLTFQRPPALLLHWASLLVTKSSSGYRMPSEILPWISVFECTRVVLCTYKTLSKWSSWDVTGKKYRNVAVGLIFTLEVDSNPHCHVCVVTLHVKNVFPFCHSRFLAQKCSSARSGVQLFLQESSVTISHKTRVRNQEHSLKLLISTQKRLLYWTQLCHSKRCRILLPGSWEALGCWDEFPDGRTKCAGISSSPMAVPGLWCSTEEYRGSVSL